MRTDAACALEHRLADPLRRALAWGPHRDGRLVLLAVTVGYLTVIATGRLEWHVDLWPYLGVPSGPSLFFDARNLTAAWECQRLGYDTLYESPCDPWGRPLNYLRPWLLLGVLGLNQSHTFALSAVLIAVMVLSFCLLLGRVPAGTGVVLALALCSPAIMLAVERANMDIAMFSVIAISLLMWRAFPRASTVFSPLIVLLAAAGKVYPVFALPAFMIARSRIAACAALLCLGTFGIYVASNFRDVQHVAQIAPQGQDFAYGARILPAHLYHYVGADHWAGPAVLKQIIAAVPLALMLGVVAMRARRRAVSSDADTPTAAASYLAFQAGTFIYLGTFAVGNNFDYRLVFLLLTLPQLLEWIRRPAHPVSSLASTSLVAVLLLLWVGSLSRQLALWDELASWMVAALLAMCSLATLPRLETIGATLVRRRATDMVTHDAIVVGQASLR